MPLLDQIIFVADAIEPNRRYRGVDQLRQIAQEDLTQAVIATLGQTITFLCKKQTVIFPLTIETYNAFITEKRKERHMTVEQELKLIVNAIDDKRAEDIVVLDMSKISPIADYFVICEGNWEKQVQAIAREVKEVAHKNELPIKRLEGMDAARSGLADLENVVVHVFHRDDRDYYSLEKLWADAPKVEVEID